MKSLNLDLAGEYLVLASTLIHIKSRMLLPEAPPDEDETEEDPRLELVQQLLEYQAYKDAALALEARPLLERDVFKRGGQGPEVRDGPEGAEEPLVEVGLLELVEAFQRVIGKLKTTVGMEIAVERISLTERIQEIKRRLQHE
jgi:segregation and condensation protein A